MKSPLLTALLAIFSSVVFSFSANSQTTITAGSSGATYTTLKAAFDAINAGTVTGAITIQVVANTAETVSAVLNASGTGSASYTAVNIYPTVTGLTISGSIAAPLIDLNGADNITIDGSLNATGSTKDLLISNTSTSAAPGTSALRFINDATSNTVKYCSIKGSETSSINGVIYFGASASGSGNDNNTFSYNNITNAGSRPVNAVYALGTTGQDNSGVSFSNNNFYDFFSQGTGGSAINVTGGNTDWTISNNSFYDTGGWNPGNTGFNIIFINNTTGNNFTVNGNYLGGTAALCGGTAFTKGGSGRDGIGCIYLIVGTSVASNIQGNTIQKFNITNNSNTRNLAGIQVDAGSVNIGTSSGNIIGASTGTGSITGFNVVNFWGILAGGAGNIDIENNTIGSITMGVASTTAITIQGISVNGPGNVIIKNNIVGSTGTANSINASSASTAAGQPVYGIVNSSTGIVTISGNTIAHLANNASGAGSFITGLYSGSGAAGSVISANFIRSLTLTNASSSADALNGISIAGGTATYSNNIVSIGDNAAATINGISDAGGTNNMYFNTVYIGGAPVAGSVPSYALFSNAANTRNYRNNLLMNARSNSGATGTNYAVGLTSTPGVIDYNNYFAPGTNGVLGVLNAVDKITLAAWKLSSIQDCNSYNESPSFASAGGTLSTNYLPGDISLMAATGTGISTDFTNTTRSSSIPAMGAFEYGITPGINSLYISSFTPVSGAPGTVVTITGSNFTGATSTSFNGMAATTYTVNSPTTITATVPAGATTGAVSAALSCGSFAAIGNFTVLTSLPVHLLEFKGALRSNSVVLEWTTSSETNSKNFEIERSYDGFNFRKAGSVNAAGNSSIARNYSFTDPSIVQENNYYRLKQVDADGKFEFSKVLLIKNPNSNGNFRVISNPFMDVIDMDFGAIQSGKIEIKLLDAAGREIYRVAGDALGQSRMRVDVTGKNIRAGIYLLQVKTSREQFIISVMKR